jgi:hypothetical protein
MEEERRRQILMGYHSEGGTGETVRTHANEEEDLPSVLARFGRFKV